MTEETITGVANALVKMRTICGRIQIEMVANNGTQVLDCDTPNILIYVQNPQGGRRKTITEKVSIRKLMEFNTLDPESSIARSFLTVMTADASGASAVAPVAFTRHCILMAGQIDLTQLMGITLNTDDEIYLDIQGLEPNGNITYVVRSLEESDHSPKSYVYNILATEATKNRKFSALSKEVLMLTRSNSLISVDFRYANGTNVNMTPQELDAHISDHFGTVYNDSNIFGNAAGSGGVVIGTQVVVVPEVQYIVPLHDVVEVQVNTDGTSLEVILVEQS